MMFITANLFLIIKYREGLEELFKCLKNNYQSKVLSGDNEANGLHLNDFCQKVLSLIFDIKSQTKIRNSLKISKKRAEMSIMVGNGLNDAGAFGTKVMFGVSVSLKM